MPYAHHCAIEIDHCFAKKDVCGIAGIGGMCDTLPQGYRCVCRKGYLKDDCSVFSPCQPNICQNGATCEQKNSTHYRCTCARGYEGDDCESKVPCDFRPCKNGGRCHEAIGGYTCKCPGNFFGRDCQFKPLCVPNPCLNGGRCDKLVEKVFECECQSGYEGARCEIVHYCDLNNCKNDGTCEERENGFTCRCLEGFEGDHCETLYDACDPNKCTKGSICLADTTQQDGFRCKCLPGTMGKLCSEPITNCDDTPCLNGGSCVTKPPDDFLCTCLKGIKGRFCEFKSPAKVRKLRRGGGMSYTDFLPAFLVLFPVGILITCLAFVYFVRQESKERVYAHSLALINDTPDEELPPTGYGVIVMHVLSVMFWRRSSMKFSACSLLCQGKTPKEGTLSRVMSTWSNGQPSQCNWADVTVLF